MTALAPAFDPNVNTMPANGPVLVIDDSLTIRKLLEMTLQRAGHAYEVAGLGKEGVALARRVRPKLILLDYVLPDGKGTDVCDELERDPLTMGVPVVIMSGKGDDIRPLFKSRRSVVEVVAKPFAPAEILHVISRALMRASVAVSAPPVGSATTVPLVTSVQGSPAAVEISTERARREAAAKVLFGALRERLARTPEWVAEAGAQPAAAFIARRLFTPEVVGAVLDGLAPLVTSTSIAAPSSTFTGTTGFLPLLPLLRVVADAHRSGVLYFGDDDGVEVWFDRGDLRLIAPRGLVAARRVLAAAGISEEPGRGLVLTSDQAPAIAAVVAASTTPLGIEVLHQHGRQALLQLTHDGPLRWSWHDRNQVPPAVERAGRTLTIDQLQLDRLRLVDDWSQIELEVRSLDQVCAHAHDFRSRLGLFTLTSDETRVLLLVDGRTAVKHILTRLTENGPTLSTFDVFHILYRLIQIRLITAGPNVAVPNGPVVLCSDRPVAESLATPLASWLARRGDVTELATCTPDQLLDVLMQAGARLVLLDVRDETRLEGLARAVRERLEISDVRLAGLVNHHDRDLQRTLSVAGCDRVLARPVHFSALERLLNGGRENTSRLTSVH